MNARIFKTFRDTTFPYGPFFLIWMLLLLSGGLFTVSSIFIVTAKIQYEPIIAQALAGRPKDLSDEIKSIHDGITLKQTFVAPGTAISQVGIGLSDFRKAKAGQIILSIRKEDSQQTFASSLPVEKIEPQNITHFPLTMRLEKGSIYELSISTSGVKASQALTLHYEPSAESYPQGSLSVSKGQFNQFNNVSGNIEFQLIQLSTSRLIVINLLASPLFYLAILYSIIILLLPPILYRHYQPDMLRNEAVPDAIRKIKLHECAVICLLGLALSVAITWPYYESLNMSDTMGDVQRNLLYRAEGRQSLLDNHTVSLWDHYSCGGMPLLGNIESPILDPFFFLLVLPFGADFGLRLTVTATLAIGFAGAYALARRFLNTGILPAILSGLIFTISGFQMMAFATGVFSWTTVGFIPWFIYFLLAAQYRTRYFIGAGLTLGVMILGGNPHMPVFAVITACFLSVYISGQDKTWRPMAVLLGALALGSLVSAIKILPAIEFISLFDNFHRTPAFAPPLSWALKMFLDRGQLAIPPWTDASGETISWNELASYVGFLPVIMTLLAAPWLYSRKYLRPWLLTGLLLFLMIFGLFPWNILRQLPVLNEMIRTSVRFRSVFVLAFALLAGAALSILGQRFIRNTLARRVITLTVVIVIGSDLFLFYSPQFSRLFDQPKPVVVRRPTFRRVSHGYTDNTTQYWHASYINYLNNEGTIDLCNPTMATNRDMPPTGADSLDETKPYFGEAFLMSTNIAVKDFHIAPNRMDASFSTPEKDWLIINENYFPGWRSVPPRQIMPQNGLLAVHVEPNDQSIKLTYRPLSYVIGKYVTISTLLLLLLWFFRKHAGPHQIKCKNRADNRDNCSH